jgi:hypothetical protein
MDYGAIRRIVEEEVLKNLSSAPRTPRLRRPVVAEAMIVSAWKRGARSLEITPGALVTPAARDRAKSLGVAIEETRISGRTQAEVAAVVDAVMAVVAAQIEGRPRTAPAPASVGGRRVVTAREIEILRWKESVLKVDAKTRITPLARDLAESYGIKIVTT